MNKEQLSEKDIEEVNGGASIKSKISDFMLDRINSRKVNCSKCGKKFRIYSSGLHGGILTPEEKILEGLCSKCKEKYSRRVDKKDTFFKR